MTITEFLTARYEAAEKVARTAFVTEEDWVAYQDPYGNTRVTGMSGAFVLRDIATKRAIAALHPCDDCGMGNDPCTTLRLLAQPYAEHPDFDPAWRV